MERAAERGVPAQTIDAVFKAFEPFERYDPEPGSRPGFLYQQSTLRDALVATRADSPITSLPVLIETAKRELREMGLTERAGQFERAGVAIAKLVVDGASLKASMVKRPSRSSPDWTHKTLSNSAMLRDWKVRWRTCDNALSDISTDNRHVSSLRRSNNAVVKVSKAHLLNRRTPVE